MAEDARPIPDPSVLTTEQLHREIEILHRRMEDRVAALGTLLNEKFIGVEAIFNEQRRGLLVAQEEREKAAQALAQTLAAQISAGDAALRDHIDQQILQVRAALTAQQRESTIIHDASQRAIDKAESANEKRFAAVNEFRSQLGEQAAALVPREVHEQAIKGLADRLHALELARASGGGAAGAERRQKDSIEKWHIWAAGGVLSIFMALIAIAANVLTAS